MLVQFGVSCLRLYFYLVEDIESYRRKLRTGKIKVKSFRSFHFSKKKVRSLSDSPILRQNRQKCTQQKPSIPRVKSDVLIDIPSPTRIIPKIQCSNLTSDSPSQDGETSSKLFNLIGIFSLLTGASLLVVALILLFQDISGAWVVFTLSCSSFFVLFGCISCLSTDASEMAYRRVSEEAATVADAG